MSDRRLAILSPVAQNLAVLALALAGMVSSFMQTILIPIQGHLPKLLQADPRDTGWAITVTLLTASVATPIAGKLGDMFGKRLVSIYLMGILLLSCAICALATNLPMLILGRGLQGLGMGVVPLGMAMLRDIMPKERLGSSVSLISGTLGVGGALGLPVSAYVTEHYDWHSLFMTAAAGTLLALLMVLMWVPKDQKKKRLHLDVRGGVGLAVLLTAFMLAISRGNVWGWGAWQTMTCAAVAGVTALWWIRHELRIDNPLVDLRISVQSQVLLTNIASVAIGFALFASSIALPQLLQLPTERSGMGVDLLRASLLLMPSGITMLLVSPVAGRIQRIYGPRIMLVAGALVLASAYVGCIMLNLNAMLVSMANMVIGLGIGLAYAAMPALIMQSVPATHTASANGVNTLMRSIGTTSAAAAIGALLAGSMAMSNPAETFQQIFMLGALAAICCAGLALALPKQ